MIDLPAQELSPDQVLWRYMDLSKFVSLLAHRSLYFSCLENLALGDPFEGFVPKQQARRLAASAKEQIDLLERELHKYEREAESFHLPNQSPWNFAPIATATVQREITTRKIARFREDMKLTELRKSFAASCWHANENESEAMWRIYSALGSGVAIETTVGNLRSVLDAAENIQIARVRYIDFEVETDEDSKSLFLLCKRKSFQHEQEVRAIVHVKKPGSSLSIPCDLSALITRVYVSPSATTVFEDAVRQLCSGILNGLKFSVQRSRLLEPPNY